MKVNPRYGTFDYAWDAQSQTFTAEPAVLELAAAGARIVGAARTVGQPSPSDQSGQPQGTPSPAAS